MNKHTFMPGSRVRAFPNGETGTVAESAPRYATLPGFVPVIFDGHDKARPCSADNLVILKPAATFIPGERVSDRGNGRLGTVADDPAMTAEYPGMVPVHWDNGYRTVAAPSILEPVAL